MVICTNWRFCVFVFSWVGRGMRTIFVSRIYRGLASYAKRNGIMGGLRFWWYCVAGGWLAAGDAYHWIHTRSRCSASYTRGGKGGRGGQCYIFYYLYTHTHTYIRIYIYAYLLLYLYVCPRSTPILYRIAHTFIAYTHFAHILDCARHARHNPYVGHARHQLCSDYARTGNQ